MPTTSPTETATASATATDTPSSTPTQTPTATASATATTTATATPVAFAMTLDVLATSDGTTPVTTVPLGGSVILRIVVTNTGTETLFDLRIVDAATFNPLVISCTPAFNQGDSLAPGAVITCTADPYYVTYGDYLAGSADLTTEALAETGGPLLAETAPVTVTVTNS